MLTRKVLRKVLDPVQVEFLIFMEKHQHLLPLTQATFPRFSPCLFAHLVHRPTLQINTSRPSNGYCTGQGGEVLAILDSDIHSYAVCKRGYIIVAGCTNGAFCKRQTN